MSGDHGCGCCPDYGPCWDHSDVLVIREGASTRTGDELGLQFIDDCAALFSPELLTDEDRRLVGQVRARLDGQRDTRSGVAWLDDHDLAQGLGDLVRDVESRLPEGTWVDWNDGYTISQPAGGPLAETGETDEAHAA